MTYEVGVTCYIQTWSFLHKQVHCGLFCSHAVCCYALVQTTGLKFMIVRFPSLTSVFPTGKGETSLIQVSLRGGYPSAWQVSCIVADSIFETSYEGFLVKIGRPKRRKMNMMWLGKAIIYLVLPLFQTTQNRRISLEKKPPSRISPPPPSFLFRGRKLVSPSPLSLFIVY